ncbi:MAG: hypothetical protein Q8N53_08360 [Longimicrobiales bacterium]|nr:hypothetical protein [Longimicrobiales bacterium]
MSAVRVRDPAPVLLLARRAAEAPWLEEAESVGGRLVLVPWHDPSLFPDPTPNLSRTGP